MRVERLARRDRYDRLRRHLVAAVRLREPALERVAVARRRRKLAVGLAVGDVLVGRRRGAAVRVEVDPVRPRAQLRVDHVVGPRAGDPLLRVALDVGERDRAGRRHPDRRVVHVDRVRPREVGWERVPSVEGVAGDGGGGDVPRVRVLRGDRADAVCRVVDVAAYVGAVGVEIERLRRGSARLARDGDGRGNLRGEADCHPGHDSASFPSDETHSILRSFPDASNTTVQNGSSSVALRPRSVPHGWSCLTSVLTPGRFATTVQTSVGWSSSCP